MREFRKKKLTMRTRSYFSKFILSAVPTVSTATPIVSLYTQTPAKTYSTSSNSPQHCLPATLEVRPPIQIQMSAFSPTASGKWEVLTLRPLVIDFQIPHMRRHPLCPRQPIDPRLELYSRLEQRSGGRQRVSALLLLWLEVVVGVVDEINFHLVGTFCLMFSRASCHSA